MQSQEKLTNTPAQLLPRMRRLSRHSFKNFYSL